MTTAQLRHAILRPLGRKDDTGTRTVLGSALASPRLALPSLLLATLLLSSLLLVVILISHLGVRGSIADRPGAWSPTGLEAATTI